MADGKGARVCADICVWCGVCACVFARARVCVCVYVAVCLGGVLQVLCQERRRLAATAEQKRRRAESSTGLQHRGTLLHEATERGDASPSSNQEQGGGRVSWETKPAVLFDLETNANAWLQACEVGRREASTRLAIHCDVRDLGMERVP